MKQYLLELLSDYGARASSSGLGEKIMPESLLSIDCFVFLTFEVLSLWNVKTKAFGR